MSKPEKTIMQLQAFATMQATIATALADALAAGVPTESIVAALAEFTRIVEEE
jgi:hypothetical protein